MAQIGAKQERLITALLSEPSVTSAAAKAAVSARTAWRWLASPEFQARLKQAKSDVFNHAKGNLQAGMVEATRTLREVCVTGEPDSARVSAAKALIDAELRAWELDELAQRIEALEVENEAR